MERGQFSRKGEFFLICTIACASLLAHAGSAAALLIPTFNPTLQATHANLNLYNGNPNNPFVAPTTPTINASSLTAVNNSWTITQLGTDVDDVSSAQGVYVLERIDQSTGHLEGGTAIQGTNYDLVHATWSSSATSSVTVTFSLPMLGDPATPSGTYELLFAEEPLTESVYDPNTDTSAVETFTDADLGAYLAGDPEFNTNVYANVRLSNPITFNYVADLPVLPQNSNVLFIPGVEASRLYRPDGNGEDTLWEPGSDADAEQLLMNPDGTSMHNDIYTRDILDNAYLPQEGNVYESFIADMNELKSSGAINNWEAAPYDWRLSLDQILSGGSQTGSNISYLTATDTPYIIQELKRLAATSRTGKVTIVAHSNGGLVAKALMEKLGATTTAALIDKVILVASPQVGTPEAVVGLLHGYGEALPAEQFPRDLDDATAREIGDTMPGLYDLLPSNSYFTYVDDPVVTFSTSTVGDWALKYGAVIHSQAGLETFLSDGSRASPPVSDLNDPTILSNSFIAQAETAHQSLDAWTPPAGVQVIQIAGWGVPTTVSGINYVRVIDQGNFILEPQPQFTLDGDGTVVTPSALWMSTTTGAVDYWVDLKKYSNDHWLSTLGGVSGTFPFTHINILEVNPVLSFITDTITNKIQSLNSYNYLSTEAPPSTGTRLRYALHSPLSLNLYDAQGDHTGMSTTTGQIDEQIPGTYYANIAGVQYIFTDASTSAQVVMQGYASGTFTFNVDELQDDSVVASTTFQNIPTSASTSVTMSVGSDITTLSALNVDENGDGTADFTLAPKLDGTVTLDTSAPSTTVSIAGTAGKNGWYTSTVLITFNATDTGSGVNATYFSLDGNATSTGATTSIATEGIHSIKYYSMDNADNVENLHTLAIKIDRTSPEAKLTFATSTQSLLITGVDNLSTTSVQMTATSSLITDQAGHTLQILFTLPKNLKARRINVSITGLKYDGIATSSSVLLKYKWNTDPASGAYTMFAAFLQTSTSTLEAHYRPLKSKTMLMLIPQDLDDSDDDSASDLRPTRLILPGMVVPFEVTNKGTVVSGY